MSAFVVVFVILYLEILYKNMKKRIIFVVGLFFVCGYLFSQEGSVATPSAIMRIPLSYRINISEITTDWFVNLQNVEMPVPGQGFNKSFLEQIREKLPPKKNLPASHPAFRRDEYKPAPPHILNSFDGNDFNVHVPNDNDLAVSNDGKIISVTNSIMCFYTADSVYHQPVSLDAFAAQFGYPEGKYDPRVLYVPEDDKFIAAFLVGFDDSTSRIIVAFSKTNDPAGEWNVYSIPGNPNNDTSWTDFPMIAVSKSDLFLTVNLLANDQPWQTGFKQTICWQFDKTSGFNGDSLVTKYYRDINYKGLRIRNLCPVQSGDRNTTEGLYFVSNKNFSVNCDSFFIGEVTGKVTDTSSKFILNYFKSSVPYGMPPLADQPLNKVFETNDSRILDGFVINNTIQFAGNSINPVNNKATVYHGIIKNINSSPEIKLNFIQHAYLEFGYPSLAWTGNDFSENESVILFNHTADTVFPGISAVFYNDTSYSDILTLKKGETRVTVQSGKNQRWGDYTGLQRVYNDTGVVWGTGYWGKIFSPANPTWTRVNGTWIAKLQSPTNYDSLKTVLVEGEIKNYPNPVTEMFTVEFYSDKKLEYNFRLYDTRGRLIHYLYHEKVKVGKNIFSFNVSPLRPGIYLLQITNSEGVKIVKRIIKS